jgi:hypothetical protein
LASRRAVTAWRLEKKRDIVHAFAVVSIAAPIRTVVKWKGATTGAF